jgi:hypothetical protein
LADIFSDVNALLSRMAPAMAFGPTNIQETCKMWQCLKATRTFRSTNPGPCSSTHSVVADIQGRQCLHIGDGIGKGDNTLRLSRVLLLIYTVCLRVPPIPMFIMLTTSLAPAFWQYQHSKQVCSKI